MMVLFAMLAHLAIAIIAVASLAAQPEHWIQALFGFIPNAGAFSFYSFWIWRGMRQRNDEGEPS
jgi:hypothetical protein